MKHEDIIDPSSAPPHAGMCAADYLLDLLRLTLEERAMLANELLKSLDDGVDEGTPEEIEAAWNEEIMRRSAEIENGTATCIPWSEHTTFMNPKIAAARVARHDIPGSSDEDRAFAMPGEMHIPGTSALSSKQKVLDALCTLDENAGFEEAIGCLRFLAAMEEGRAQLDAGQRIDHDEIKRRHEI
jgi:Putative addiction module component